MRIVWLLESTDQLWGGVKVALTDANWLADRGHEVTVVSRTAPPDWLQLRCAFRRVERLTPDVVPPADVVVGTYWTTVATAATAAARQGAVAVHFCQGYEGDMAEHAPHRAQIETIYRLPGVRHVTIASHLTRLLRERFDRSAFEIVNAIDHTVHHPGPPRRPGAVARIGLVGPYQVAWKDIATGLEACRLAHAAGRRLELVRITNTAPDARERNLPFPVEWHERIAPQRMGDLYRSMDMFLGTSSGSEEGFFLPAVEAMACGVPCVLTDVPAFRGHGDHQYALFVPPRDPAAMAEALVVTTGTPDIAAALRTGGLAAACRYTQAAHGEGLERAFAQMLAAQTAQTGRGAPAPANGADLDATAVRIGRELRDSAGRAREAGDARRAASFLAAAHCLGPADAELAADTAWALHEAGDTEAALRMFAALGSDGHDHPSVHERHATLLSGSGRPAAAAAALRAAIAAGRRSATTYNDLGIALYRAGDVAGARTSFERALVLDPDHQDARANLADLAAEVH